MTTQAAIDRAIAEGKVDMQSVDSATRRRLQARYQSSMEIIEGELRRIALQLDAMGDVDLVTPNGRYTRQGRLWRQQHLSGLLDLMEREYQRNAALGSQDVAQAQRQAVDIGRQTVGNMGLEGGVGPALNTAAYERLVAATGYGSPLRAVMESYGPIAEQVIERKLIEGIMQGHGADKIIRGIRREIGATGVPPWRLEALVRTEGMRAFRGSLSESYKALGVEQVRWLSAHSARTCLACLGRDGDLFPADYQMDSHVSCRCILSPYTGRSQRETGEEWLRRQPEAVQRQKLGSAFDAWQRGDVGLKDFVGQRQSRVWGRSIYQRTPRQALAARGGAVSKGPPTSAFASLDEARAWAESQYRGWPSRLTDVERDAVWTYRTSGYHDMNGALRNGTLNDDDLRAEIEAVDRALSKSEVDRGVVVYRGINTRRMGDVTQLPGTIIEDKGFVSTSLDEGSARKFVNYAIDDEKPAALVKITVPKGTNGAYLDSLDPESTWREDEMLLPRNTKFHVTSVVKDDDGIPVISMEVVP